MTAASLPLSADLAPAASAPAAPSFRSAFIGFVTSTLGVTVAMVLLSAL